MTFVGSKRRHARFLVPILEAARRPDQTYVEPFCGGCNLLEHLANPRVANDAHRYLIEMWRALTEREWRPPWYVSEATFRHMRTHPEDYPPELVGFVGFVCAFGSCWFAGYARCKAKRNYAAQGARGILKQLPKLLGVEWHNEDYLALRIPPRSLVYCDPPYHGTTGYAEAIGDVDVFWNWVRSLGRQGHTVFVSEYRAPDDFEVVWERETSVNIDATRGGKPRVERLFRRRS